MYLNKKYLILILAFVFTLTSALSGAAGSSIVKADETASSFYVSTTGSDSNDGSIDTPWKTFKHASSLLVPGDTLFVRGGTYSETDVIDPTNSGTKEQPITIKSYNSEEPILKFTADFSRTWGGYNILFDLTNRSYFIIEGLSFIDVGYANENAPGGVNCIWIYNSTGIIVRNCVFNNTDVVPPKTDPVRANSPFIPIYRSTYITVENCYFNGTGTGLIGAGAGQNEAVGITGGSYMLIQNNHFGNCGHSATACGNALYDWIPSKHDAYLPATDIYFQNNVIENHWGGGIYFGGDKIVIQNNTIYYVGEQVEYGKAGIYGSASHVIIRNNQVVKTSAVSTAVDNGIVLYAYYDSWSQTNNFCQNNRLYNNVVFHCGNSAIKLGEAAASKLEGNEMKNNIFFSNDLANPDKISEIDFNTTWTSDRREEWLTKFPFENNFFGNIILHDPSTIGQPVVWFDFARGLTWRKSLAQMQTEYPANFSDNIEVDPMFVNVGSDTVAGDDFHLQANSPALDTGLHLTKTTAAGTDTTVLQVEDASYFTTGCGVIPEDCLKIGNNPIVMASKIDLATNTITLSSPVTYSAGDYVDLPYSGNAPDIGSYEMNPVVTPAPIYAIPEITPVPTPTLTPVPTPKPTPKPTKTPKPTATATPAVTATATATATVTATATPTPTLPPVTLSDIDGHWAQGYIQQLVDRGIIGGYPDGTFKPENPISRAEFCTIITKALVNDGVLADFMTTTGTFTDVPADLWSVKYIETAYASGFVGGKAPGIFDPEAFITRQEMAKIISLVYCAKNSADFNTLRDSFNAGDYNLSDLTTADDWAMSFIKVALVVVAMRGNEDGTFSPLGLVTRAETATVTFRILGLTLGTPTPAPTSILTPSPTPTATATITPTPTPVLTPVPTPAAIRSHGTQLTFTNITRSNYPDFVQDPNTTNPMTILSDGVANDLLGCITCNLDEPEYLFDLGSVKNIQSFAIKGYGTTAQNVLFRLLISPDNESWTELGVDVPLKIAQPVITDKSIYIKDNFDDANNKGRMNPAPDRFDTTTSDEIFTIGNFQNRTLLDPNGNERDVECFASPRMNNKITTVDWQAYGFVDDNCNYLFHYFMDDVQTAQYIKIIGYGNDMTLWYMFSSISEVQVFGPDVVV